MVERLYGMGVAGSSSEPLGWDEMGQVALDGAAPHLLLPSFMAIDTRPRIAVGAGPTEGLACEVGGWGSVRGGGGGVWAEAQGLKSGCHWVHYAAGS